MTCADVERLADAYIDGELALEDTLALEAHVEHCAACAARLHRIRAVRSALREAPYFRAPDGMAARIAIVRPRVRRRSWLVPALSLAAVVLVIIGVQRQWAAVAADATTEAVIEGHVRSLMADHLMDVASTDRHTVKPWFAGRLDFSPTVVDLASEGFPLVGGRVDYIDHHAAAALVYKRRDHVVNVFMWPSAGGSASHASRSDARGYHVIYWTRGGVAVWVVSDLAAGELDDFARRLDAGVHE